MRSERGFWARKARLDDLVWSLLCAVFAAPVLTFGGLIVALVYRCGWLGFLVLGIGGYVQQKLVELGVMAPATGGHMPDFGFPPAFDLVSLFVLILAAWHGGPRLVSLVLKLRGGKE